MTTQDEIAREQAKFAEAAYDNKLRERYADTVGELIKLMRVVSGLSKRIQVLEESVYAKKKNAK